MMTRSAIAGDLPVVERRSDALSLPKNFLGLSGTGRLKAILDLPDPGAFLRRLRADEFSFLLNGIGLEDAGCLFRYSTKSQRLALFDMDAFNDREFLTERFDRLLDVAKEAGLEFSVKLIKDLDPELVVLSLLKRASFYTLEEAEDIEFQDGTTFLTPDNVFMVACQDPEDVPAVRAELDLVYAVGVEFAHRLIQAGRFDTVSSLEYQTGRYRRLRLSSYGFPDDDNRDELYEPFDLNGFKARVLAPDAFVPLPGLTPGEPLALAMAGTSGGLFFWRVMNSAQAVRLNSAFIFSQTMNLINRLLGTVEADLAVQEEWDRASGQALTMMSIGLEAVAGDDIELAVDVLSKAVPLELFRAGIELARPANIVARQVVADVGGLANLVLFGEGGAADIDAVASFPPKCPPSVAHGPSRDFLTAAEVAAGLALMKKYRAVVQFATGVLGFAPERKAAGAESIVEATFLNVVATAWARQLLGGSLSIEPLTSSEVSRLCRLVFLDGRLRPELRLATSGSDDYSSAVAEFLDESLDLVEQSLGGLGESFDIGMIGNSLLVR